MKLHASLLLAAPAMVLAVELPNNLVKAADSSRPNIVLIMADDKY